MARAWRLGPRQAAQCSVFFPSVPSSVSWTFALPWVVGGQCYRGRGPAMLVPLHFSAFVFPLPKGTETVRTEPELGVPGSVEFGVPGPLRLSRGLPGCPGCSFLKESLADSQRALRGYGLRPHSRVLPSCLSPGPLSLFLDVSTCQKAILSPRSSICWPQPASRSMEVSFSREIWQSHHTTTSPQRFPGHSRPRSESKGSPGLRGSPPVPWDGD